ncbi:FxsA family protein [Desulfolucanica intricata]|uniref:FxsA family protein n=1 Tax=Desulfolucanica intricata TaxID=1285191 RepID=UPI000833C859|nr:FxsA family protein [Desulfolucanica intricata]
MRWLLIFFIIMPIVELYILVYLSKIIGFWYTLFSVILIGMLGFHLARSQGFLLFKTARREFALGRVPGNEVLDALIVMTAGLLLITPGLITDTVGVTILIPRVRTRLRNIIKQWLLHQIKLGTWKFNIWRL